MTQVRDGRLPSGRLSDEDRAELEDRAYRIRRLTIELVTSGRWGHIGGSLSMADILAVLYFHELVVDPERPDWEGRDRFVLSKAHASPGLYAALAVRGFFPVDELYDYTELGGLLEGHADMTRTPGLESSGGLLGIGLSVAQGMALGQRLKEQYRGRTYCMMGDGEQQEGNIWEAAMSAAHYGLDNLIAVVDSNAASSDGFVARTVGIEPLADKWRAFGWEVLEVDGHDLDALTATFYRARWILPRGKPIVVIARTVKGRGLRIAENSYKWHTHAPSPEVADEMLRDLARAYGRPEDGYSRLGQPHEREALHV